MTPHGRVVLHLRVIRSNWFRHEMKDHVEVTETGYWRVTLRDGEEVQTPWYHPDTMPPYLLRQIRDEYLRTLTTGTEPEMEE
jgi:hypothetical protein